jgi:polysaccharide biosynthesis protein PslH
MDGGAICLNNLTFGLNKLGHSVKVLSVNTHKHFVDIKLLPEYYRSISNIEFSFIDTRIKPISAFFNLFSNKSYHITRFYNSKMEKKLIELLNKTNYDFIIMESIFLIDYLEVIRKNTKAKIILRAPNIEFKIWEKLAKEQKNPVKKWYLNLLSDRLKTTELLSMNKFDGIVTVTENDLNFFQENGLKKPGEYVPIGIDVEKEILIPTEINNKKEKITVFHLGALDWMPNQAGINWLLGEVWPIVINQLPDAQIFIAGRRPQKELYNWQSENIIIEGEIENAGEFIQKHEIMVVPLFSGSGMRVKIIEGMMLGKAIISTSIGAEGIQYKNGEDIIIAETKEEFANGLIELLTNKQKLLQIQIKAAENCKEYYSNKKLTEKFENFLKYL